MSDYGNNDETGGTSTPVHRTSVATALTLPPVERARMTVEGTSLDPGLIR